MKVIVYKTTNDSIAIVHPKGDNLTIAQIEKLADDVVPLGKAYALVEASDLPTDRSRRDDWTIADEYLVDGIGKGYVE